MKFITCINTFLETNQIFDTSHLFGIGLQIQVRIFCCKKKFLEFT